MTDQSITIGPMAKIELNLEILTSAQSIAALRPPKCIRFIYGLGADGLSPFERMLYGKAPGDSIRLRIEKEQAHDLFEHLACALLDAAGSSPPFDLKVNIASVIPATSREVVKAMAQLSGCGGDCGCGCGGQTESSK